MDVARTGRDFFQEIGAEPPGMEPASQHLLPMRHLHAGRQANGSQGVSRRRDPVTLATLRHSGEFALNLPAAARRERPSFVGGYNLRSSKSLFLWS